MSEMLDFQDKQLAAFWTHAINVARLNPSEAFNAQDDLVSLRPPAFSVGDTAPDADTFCADVLAGKRTAVCAYAPGYVSAGVAYPQIGDLGILCDGQGVPRALLRTSKVRILPFEKVSVDLATAVGENKIVAWRASYVSAFTAEAHELGGQFAETDDIVFEFFEVLYSTERA